MDEDRKRMKAAMRLLRPGGLVAAAFTACALSPAAHAESPMSLGPVASGTCTGTLCLTLTVTTDPPPACGTATTLAVAVGTPVNFCYTVSNASGTELDYQSLADTLDPSVFWLLEQPLASGSSWQYNRVVTALQDIDLAATWTAQDVEPGYTNTVTSGGFVDITATGTPLGIGNEAIKGVLVPFAFDFYGRTSNHVCVSSDGFALFDLWPCPTYSYYSTQTLPTPYLPAPTFLALWEELVVGNGEVYSATLGTAPNRRFVVEWYQRPPYSSEDGFTFELILDESTNRISFEYQDVDTTPSQWSGGGLATIGLQANTTLADQYSYFFPSVTSGSGIEWLPTSPTIYAATASASVTVGGPVMTVAPGALHLNTLSGTLRTADLSISNSGNVPLSWSLVETPAQPPRAPSGMSPAPGFAEDLSNGEFVTFDASDPTLLVPIAPTDYLLAGGDFVDNDPTRLIAIDGSSTAHRNAVVSVDTATGATQDIGIATPVGTGVWTSMKWDATTHTLYAVAADCQFTNSTLYTIDRGSGSATRIGPIATGAQNCIMNIAIDSAGRMYGIDLVNIDSLVSIDKVTGVAQRIGPLGVDADGNQGMEFDDVSGILYWARYAETSPGVYVSEMRTINTMTGAASLIAPIGGADAPQIAALAIGARGDCQSPANVSWLSLAPPSGTTDADDQSAVTVTFDATGLAAGTYAATLCVVGNDPDTPIQHVPVELDVIDANDVIFRNGFEGS